MYTTVACRRALQQAEQAVAACQKAVAAAQYDAACLQAEAADAQRRLVATRQALEEQGAVHQRVSGKQVAEEACRSVLKQRVELHDNLYTNQLPSVM